MMAAMGSMGNRSVGMRKGENGIGVGSMGKGSVRIGSAGMRRGCMGVGVGNIGMGSMGMREYDDTKCGDEERGVLDEGGNISKGSIGIRSMRVGNICKVGGVQSV
jgi:hypothetical protein